MRAVLILTAIGLGLGYVGVRHLAEDAQAEPVQLDVRPQQILSVALDGRGLPTAALREVLETRAGGLIDLATVERDRVALTQTLVARGYLTAKVAEPRVMFGAGGAVYVTFPIQQGTLFRIRAVTVEGASAAEAGIVTFDGGDIADADRIARARKAVEERVRVRGTQHAVTAELVLDGANALADLRLTAR